MLGYIVAEGRGVADALLCNVAQALKDQGIILAGAVQTNLDTQLNRKCDMDLHILSGSDVVRISQNLGALSQGCRLDPDGLERAVGLVASALETTSPDLLIVNKFGKQELDGRGFYPVIGEALGRDIPVLTAVNAGSLAGFEAWSDGLAEPIAPSLDQIFDWTAAQGAGTAVTSDRT